MQDEKERRGRHSVTLKFIVSEGGVEGLAEIGLRGRDELSFYRGVGGLKALGNFPLAFSIILP